jgi:hypothetical protein
MPHFPIVIPSTDNSIPRNIMLWVYWEKKRIYNPIAFSRKLTMRNRGKSNTDIIIKPPIPPAIKQNPLIAD